MEPILKKKKKECFVIFLRSTYLIIFFILAQLIKGGRRLFCELFQKITTSIFVYLTNFFVLKSTTTLC